MKNRILSQAGALAFCCWFLHVYVAAQNRDSPPKDARTSERHDYASAIDLLEAAIRYEMDAKSIPALSIALVDRDQIVWSAGFGFQDAAEETPATAATVYRVGSVSKLFTDIAIMQLVEAGKLDLDRPVQQYLPDFSPINPYKEPITLRQLMSHRSGLVRESPVGNYFDPSEPSLTATVASLNNTQLVYPPDKKTKYSNAAVSVLGAILEREINGSHPEFVAEKIFKPLELRHSSFEINEKVKADLATGWMRTYDGRRFEAPTFLLGTGPAGNLYSSMEDLGKFLIWLLDDSEEMILRRETLQAMTAPVRDETGQPLGFGLGFHVQDLTGHRKIGHGGAIYGFSTQVEALPERGIGVTAASSLDGSNGLVTRLADYALELMLAVQDGQTLPEYQRTASVPESRAKELVGHYRSEDRQDRVHIFELAGELAMQRGSFTHQLRSSVDDGRVLVDDLVSFGSEVKLNEPDKLTVGATAYARMTDKPPKDAPTRWQGLIGEYGWDHNTLYILEMNGRLYALIEWFYYYPLTEISSDEFRFPDYGLYHGEGLKFTRNSADVAEKVVAAEVTFARREVGSPKGQIFRIEPVRPIADLRAEALSATPPTEKGNFRDSDLVEITSLDSSIRLDIRYASTNNFTGARFYQQPRAFMQGPAAQAVVRAHQQLKQRGLGLLIHDAYRPWYVTKMFWDATPAELKDFVANPANGSRHNRGCAVDLTLCDLNTGEPIEMVSGYDEFSPRSFPLYPGGTSRQRWYRELLRQTMESEGFEVYEFEWWHFDHQDWQQYRIANERFEEIAP